MDVTRPSRRGAKSSRAQAPCANLETHAHVRHRHLCLPSNGPAPSATQTTQRLIAHHVTANPPQQATIHILFSCSPLKYSRAPLHGHHDNFRALTQHQHACLIARCAVHGGPASLNQLRLRRTAQSHEPVHRAIRCVYRDRAKKSARGKESVSNECCGSARYVFSLECALCDCALHTP